MDIKNEAQLKKLIMEKCTKAIADAEAKIYGEVAQNLDTFYSEFKPEEYIRTYALLNSLEHTPVSRSGNQYGSYVKAEVHFNTPDYQQGIIPLQHTPEHGMYGYNMKSGEEVLDITMMGNKPHGGHIEGTAIWRQSMKNLGGKRGIENLIKQELKKQGL